MKPFLKYSKLLLKHTKSAVVRKLYKMLNYSIITSKEIPPALDKLRAADYLYLIQELQKT